MSIYLAWSVYKLIGVLVVWGLFVTLFYRYGVKVIGMNILLFPLGRTLIIGLVGALLIVLASLNIGDRQADLKRQRFDAKPPEQVERVEAVPRRNIEQVQQAFEQAVKKTN